jgi:hypothetical protein
VPVFAFASFVCGLVAMGWLRGFGVYSLDSVLPVGLGLASAGALAAGVAYGGRRPPAEAGGRSFLARLASMAGAVIVASGATFWIVVIWAGRLGAYAVPHAPLVGVFICASGMALGIISIMRRERALAVSSVGILLGFFVLLVPGLVDRLTHSPYLTTRQFAAAAYRGDQEAMKRLFSARSLRHFSELPVTTYYSTGGEANQLVTVDHMCGETARNTLLLSLRVRGDTARFDCLVPYRWRAFTYQGSASETPLVREEGRWRIDVYSELESFRERFRDQE